MRTVTMAVLLALAAQSAHYEMSVTPNGGEYVVVVTDRDSHAAIATFNLSLSLRAVTVDAGDLRTIAHLRPGRTDDAIHVTIMRDKARVDSLALLAPLPEGQERPVYDLPQRVGGDVRAPRVIHRVEPLYPAEVRAQHISGVVILETEISETGDIEDVMVLKGPPELSQLAADAVSQWKFEPATIEGKPVRVVFNLTVNFKLN
jgi:TonB family protein